MDFLFESQIVIDFLYFNNSYDWSKCNMSTNLSLNFEFWFKR